MISLAKLRYFSQYWSSYCDFLRFFAKIIAKLAFFVRYPSFYGMILVNLTELCVKMLSSLPFLHLLMKLFSDFQGNFFSNGGSGQSTDGTFRLTADGDWDSLNGFTF